MSKEKEQKLSVILFDLGFTLINFEGDFQKTLRESYAVLADSLVDAGCQLDKQKFTKSFNGVISDYYRNRAVDLIERPVEEFLQKTLESFSITNLPAQIIERAVEAMYTYTESWWKIEPDAHQTLTELKNMGYRLGLISNASNTPDLNRLIDNNGLRKYFDIIVISAELGIRKPDPRIFIHVLNQMQVKPENAIMVGDTLPADILGAKKSGLRSVWVTRRADRSENNAVINDVQPDYTVPDLVSLIDLVQNFSLP